MRVWLYYRLSRDEDDERNSLRNQRSIIESYAISNGHEIIGESFDDNVSGMHFEREGIAKIYEVVDAGRVDAIVVKDLSRLGRHRTQTALFIDYLRENNVRVLSATEGIDTFNENDDLIIGFKGLVNDFYARDGSRRVRTGYRQKQKNGIVITPPFGYFKDKNTNQVTIVPESADTIRLIYSSYISGMGFKAIARMLNEQKHKTPAKMQLELIGKRMPQDQEKILKKYLWDATMVSRILQEEAYTGTLICHKSERNKINKTFRYTDPEEQFRHENFLPVIIPRELWEEVQFLIQQRKKQNVRAAPDQRIHRYSGLILCGDCGRSFLGKRIKLKDGDRVEYICSTYHRYGKEHCSAHAIREEFLDEVLKQELLNAKCQYESMWDSLEDVIESWLPKTDSTATQIKKQKERIDALEEEVETILMERIRDKANAERFDRMITKREEQIAQAKKRIAELENIGQVIRSRQAKLRKDIGLIDEILADGTLTEAHLRLLVEKIYVYENEGSLSLDIHIKAPFQNHTDSYENGVLTGSEIEELIGVQRMRVWIYGRLSNDDDREMDSLTNQMEIGRNYACRQGYQVVGESFDDNVSGMRFDRRGLNHCTEAVEQGQVDAIIVKDLSRLGRHKTQTALFIDYLRQQNVAVLSVTENLNTLLDEDDLIIGVRGLMNDYYAKDIGNKIRHGYREKQKVGLVITPPFGYWKDRNTNCIHQHPEAAETVRLIYDYYLQGVGQKEIARRLNRLGRKTPAQLRAERYGREFYASRKDQSGQYVWTYVSVKNVLMEEGYTGVLINHRTETRNGKAKPVPVEHWQRHEDFYPAIITKEEWLKTQSLLKQNARPAVQNRAAHRYSGLLTCGNCGQPFVPMIRYWNGHRRVEYVCKGYQNHGKEFCSSHRIREECLDAQVVQYAKALRENWAKEQADLQRLYKQWSLRQPVLDREIARLREEIRQTEDDIDELLMMRIQSAK